MQKRLTRDALSERFLEMLRLEQDWDSYGADKPDPMTLSRAMDFVKFIGDEDLPTDVWPTTEGGVSLVWENEDVDPHRYAEIEFSPKHFGHEVYLFTSESKYATVGVISNWVKGN